MQTLDEGIAQANDVANKAKILRVGSDLTTAFMQEAAPRLDLTLKMAAIAGEDDAGEMVNIIMSTALGIIANVMNFTAESLEGFHPVLKQQFLALLPKIAQEISHATPGDVKMMDVNGNIVDQELSKELEAVFREQYAMRSGGTQGAKRQGGE